MHGKELAVITVVFTLAVLMPLSIGFVLRMMRRSVQDAPPALDHTANARLERLEQAMDAIAIEIERISEGQRFVTRVLTERPVESLRPTERQSLRSSITPH